MNSLMDVRKVQLVNKTNYFVLIGKNNEIIGKLRKSKTWRNETKNHVFPPLASVIKTFW